MNIYKYIDNIRKNNGFCLFALIDPDKKNDNKLTTIITKINKGNFHAILIPVAIINGIKNFLSINVDLKWPNDIMYNNKKLGGVLIESKINREKIILNIGIGLNVNEGSHDFPDTLKQSCISLKEIKGHPIQREPLLAFILNELNQLIDNIDTALLIKQWMQSCMHKNKRITFTKITLRSGSLI